MLKQLHILNYAIIENIRIDFSMGLNAITGETGAGKSILMGALSLILGDRADTSVLLDRTKKCFIEGSFAIENKEDVRLFLLNNDLDPENELVIRREISASGKSRAFVNDTPVNLDQLRLLSSMLVDLHRQFDTLELGETGFQRQVIDALAGHNALLHAYQKNFHLYSSLKKELAVLHERKVQFHKEYDYHKFLFDELEEAGFHKNELEDLDAELKLLTHSEGIKNALSNLMGVLKDNEQPVVQQLKSVANQLQPFTTYHPELPALLQRLQSAHIELQDLAEEAENINNRVGDDAQRIEQINERISTGYKLLKKHGLHHTDELLTLQEDLHGKLQAVLQMDESLSATGEAMNKAMELAGKQAAQLSHNRQLQVKPFEDKVNGLLKQVGMPNARLKVSLQQGDLHEFGIDAISFLFDANKSNRFEPLRKVASGGELSRLMLCIKSLVAQSIDLPTLIFDEIDSGISGEAARQVGIILKGLSQQRQVVCITHQPQIAGKADTHFFVFKEIRGEGITTNIRVLTQSERITAIAQMLGGEKPTAAALENAREMVMN